MTIKVAWQLRPSAGPADGTAVLLPSRNIGELLSFHAQLGQGDVSAIHDTAAGWLVRLSGRAGVVPPCAVRLKEVAANLLIPIDADLLPPLTPEEAKILTRHRGLVFLPHREALAFAPNESVSVTRFLDGPVVRESDWKPFPTLPARATRIDGIFLATPDDLEDDILSAGAEEIGTEADYLRSQTVGYRTLARVILIGLGLLFLFGIVAALQMMGDLGSPGRSGLLGVFLLLLLAALLLVKYWAAPAANLMRPGGTRNARPQPGTDGSARGCSAIVAAEIQGGQDR